MEIRKLVKDILKISDRLSPSSGKSGVEIGGNDEWLSGYDNVRDALELVREEVNREEYPGFWLEMRRNVEAGLHGKRKRDVSVMTMLAGRWWMAIPVPVAAAAAMLLFMSRQTPCLTEDDLLVMNGSLPLVEEVATEEIPGQFVLSEGESYRGISNGWTVLIDETL